MMWATTSLFVTVGRANLAGDYNTQVHNTALRKEPVGLMAVLQE